MRKVFIFVIIFLGIVVVLKANDFPYKPKPILLIHGYNGNSKTWGAGAYMDGEIRTDSIHPDSIETGFTYEHLLNYMNHYAWVLDTLGYDTTYTKPGGVPNYPNPDPGYPNKTFLEVINMDDPWGSVDPDPENYPSPFTGQGDELVHRIIEVLEEYYGNNWQSNPEAKVILISHSLGGLDTREALNSVHRYSLFAERRTNNAERKKEWFYVLSLN